MWGAAYKSALYLNGTFQKESLFPTIKEQRTHFEILMQESKEWHEGILFCNSIPVKNALKCNETKHL